MSLEPEVTRVSNTQACLVPKLALTAHSRERLKSIRRVLSPRSSWDLDPSIHGKVAHGRRKNFMAMHALRQSASSETRYLGSCRGVAPVRYRIWVSLLPEKEEIKIKFEGAHKYLPQGGASDVQALWFSVMHWLNFAVKAFSVLSFKYIYECRKNYFSWYIC